MLITVFYLLKQKTGLGNNLITNKTGTKKKFFEKKKILNVMFLLHYRKKERKGTLFKCLVVLALKH